MNLMEIDFGETGKVMKLDLGTNQSHVFAGDVVKDSANALFKFLGLEP